MSSPPSGANKVRQVEAIANGTVIDHIPAAVTLQVVNLLARADDQVFIGVNLRSSRQERKGVVKIANRELEDREVSALSLIAPEASVYNCGSGARPTEWLSGKSCAMQAWTSLARMIWTR